MENRVINLAVVAEVAEALKTFKDQVVFVGGAVISLYTDDPAADEIRPTGDIDMTLKVFNLGRWSEIQKELKSLGFHPDPFGHSICSYKFKNIAVDIMSSEDGPLGPANRWYKLGFLDLWSAKAKDQIISIIPAPCYLASKFEAFNDRGKDYRTSHDIEDIIYIIDNRTTIIEEVEGTHPEVKKFLKIELEKLAGNNSFEEILSAHLHPLILEERQPIFEEKINKILSF